jgi:hypothetical protein
MPCGGHDVFDGMFKQGRVSAFLEKCPQGSDFIKKGAARGTRRQMFFYPGQKCHFKRSVGITFQIVFDVFTAHGILASYFLLNEYASVIPRD